MTCDVKMVLCCTSLYAFGSLIIPTGRRIACFCQETCFWPGQGIFIAHNDDGKNHRSHVSKGLTLLPTVFFLFFKTSPSSDKTEVQYHSFDNSLSLGRIFFPAFLIAAALLVFWSRRLTAVKFTSALLL